MPGPRSYPTAVEKALFQLSRGTCYFPDCRVSVVVFIDPSTPVVNVHICHIKAAKEGAPRYDPGMTNLERASFPNLLLLCKPHHDLVDRVRPEDYSVETLSEWKRSRETSSDDRLAELELPNDDSLAELIEAAVTKIGPRRDVVVEIGGGTFAGGGVLTLPISGWKEIIDLNPHFADEAVLVATTRNVGGLPVFVDAVEFHYYLSREGSESRFGLMGRNDFLTLNPTLPKEVPVGASTNWFMSLDTVRWILARSEGSPFEFTSLEAEVHLGTGERITSPKVPMSQLPL